jgi:thiol-disulfide isomerase/thioredoxin
MHRQNILAIGLLLLVSLGELAAGYASRLGPLGVLSYAATRFSHGSSERFLISESKSSAAPEFAPGRWVNTEPLTLKGLRGRVVLIEFWTFGCFNCRNTLPWVKDWDSRFREKGLTIVGVHSPELDDEKNFENVPGSCSA